MALTKLTSNLIEGGTGTDWVTAIQTSNFTAAAGKGYFVNTTSQVLYVNLPVGVVGMEITIQDYAGTFATNKVILNANGSEKIQGSALEGRINTNNATAVLIYQDATKGWTSQDVTLNQTEISWATPTGQSLTYSTPSPQSSQGAAAATFPTTTFTATLAGSIISGTATIAGLPSGITAAQTITGSGVGNTLTVTLTGTFPSTSSLNTNLTLSGLTVAVPINVEFLVVAGGASGGADGPAGGGAGGLRTSWTGGSGGGGSSEGVLSLIGQIPVTIGAGGAGTNVGNSVGNNGTNSIISSITSIGGGGGGAYLGSNGNTGGSGGGGGNTSGGGSGLGGAGTTNQGFAGGNGIGGAAYYPGGGGGGAGAAGANASNSTTAGSGGNGKSVSITGSSITYAGGGGGGGYNNLGYPGSGGSGGGGVGSSTSNATSGSPNTGSGGGGTGSPNYSGAGGSGIVILRYPNSKTITNPGSGLTFTTATVSTDRVTTFTAGTGNIQFN